MTNRDRSVLGLATARGGATVTAGGPAAWVRDRAAPLFAGARLLALGLLGLVAVWLFASRSVEPSALPAAATLSQRVATLGLAGLPREAQAAVSTAVGQAEPAYRARPLSQDTFALRSQSARLRARLGRAGAEIDGVEGLRLGFGSVGYGYGSATPAITFASPSAHANRVVYRSAEVRSWYAAGPLGIDQGFDLLAPPRSRARGPLTIAITTSGDGLRALPDGDVAVGARHGTWLLYRGLSVTDASGRSLPARLQVQGQRILLRVDDRRARFPLRVDPMIQQGGKLDPTDASGSFPAFGTGVSMSSDGDTLLVGGGNDGDGLGAAWVFTRSGDTWTQQGPKLTPDDATGTAAFGQTVSLSADGNTALIGGFNDNNGLGAAWVFTRTGTAWAQQGPKLAPDDATVVPGGTLAFGIGVALSGDGDTALVGGNADNGGIGAAWVFTRSAGAWSQQGPKLVPDDETVPDGGSAESTFGSAASLSADGNTALIGGPNDGAGLGAAWIFTRSGSSWSQQGAKLAPTPDEVVSGQSYEAGSAVALSADASTALVGSSAGAAWVFTSPDATWTQQGPALAPSDADSTAYGATFGNSVALSSDGSTAIVGAESDAANAGAAWIFTRANDGSWSQAGPKLTPTDEALYIQGGGCCGTLFGDSVAITGDGNTALVGGYGDGNETGAAWVFANTDPVAPSAPQNVIAAGGDGDASVSWTPPLVLGGSPLASYTVQASPGGESVTVDASQTTAAVSGLSNGVPYTFTVTATNGVGPGPASDPSALAVTPEAGASTPTTATGFVTTRNGSVTTDPNGVGPTSATPVTASVSPDTGSVALVAIGVGSLTAPPPTGYAFVGSQVNVSAPLATSQCGGHCPAPYATSIQLNVASSVLDGADPSTVTAFLTDGSGDVSSIPPCSQSTNGPPRPDPCVFGPSASGGTVTLDVQTAQLVTLADSWNIAVPLAPPGAPGGVVAAAGDSDASVSWVPPSLGPVSSYTVTASPGGATVTVDASQSSAVVSGLTDGTSYTFTVTASNDQGPGPASDPSAPVTPQVAALPPVTVAATVPAQGGTVTTDPGNAGPSAQDPVTTAVTSPGGGTVGIAEGGTSGSPTPTGFTLLGEQVQIVAPPATPGAPLTLVFSVDPSLLGGADPATVTIFRTEDGGSPTALPSCAGSPGQANPDPCLSSVVTLAGGAAQFTVLTSTASLWNLAVPASVEPAVSIDSLSKTLLGRSDPTVAVRWHADENGAYSVRVGGTDCSSGVVAAQGGYTGAPAVHSTSIATSTLAEGQNTIRVCVTDSAARTRSATVTLTKDTTAPVVAVDSVSPSPLRPSDTSTTVTWHAGENGSYSVLVNATTCGGTATASGDYASAPATVATPIAASQLHSGANSVRVCVTDAAGNTGSAVVAVTRNTQRQTTTTATCSPNPGLPGHSVTCTAVVADTDLGIVSTPSGTVSWSVQAGAGSFGSSSCKLSGGSCHVSFTAGSSQKLPQQLRASYGGEATHAASAGSATLALVAARDDRYATRVSTALSIAAPGVLANDLPPTGPTARLVARPSSGSVALSANGSFTYTPHSGFVGTDTFTYSALDGGLVSSPATVTLFVLGPAVKCASCNLSGLTLSGDNLTGANFADANLMNANLKNANLSRVTFTGANLSGAATSGAVVSGATWSNTTCPDATNSNSHSHTCVGHGF